MAGPELQHHRERYLEGVGATELHTVDIWTYGPASPSTDLGKTWIIFIHGGAWRDPEVDSMSFEPAVTALSNLPIRSSIAGFVSINYRLSPYPSHSKYPSPPDDPSRNVQHPCHLEDVGHALLYLDGKYGIEDRYMLVGHSAGATMAFGLYLSLLPDRPLPRPACVLGIAGIYDFDAFVEAHKSIPVYQQFMESAFPERSAWHQVSPSTGLTGYDPLWERAKIIVISNSDEDQLVEKEQDSYMLKRVKSRLDGHQQIHSLAASGGHNEIWQSGHILAGLIVQSMQWLQSLSGPRS
ncbi:uncharacterized protein BP5553_02246 [Venustampulla echinocandica]|uniref:Kynurenine formamidase n=1 Tax=Venustampulla echinocandica TaxID=2656787 RepID=A0A370U3B1_9HELO|nr:uncharacterized protein BP5553_02246 [Venustampulla echinocandica]RDL42267.1 hypothetical protein BP5553_02246 [Venustampulla echinocandica]